MEKRTRRGSSPGRRPAEKLREHGGLSLGGQALARAHGGQGERRAQLGPQRRRLLLVIERAENGAQRCGFVTDHLQRQPARKVLTTEVAQRDERSAGRRRLFSGGDGGRSIDLEKIGVAIGPAQGT